MFKHNAVWKKGLFVFDVVRLLVEKLDVHILWPVPKLIGQMY